MAKPRGSYLRFGCPRCLARLKARPAQAGTKRRCPRCHLLLTVPDAAQAAALSIRPEEYALHEGEYVAATPMLAVECPVCRTRIYATEEEVGQRIECPDCGTAVAVSPPPSALPEETAPAIVIDEYAIHEEAPQQAGSEAVDEVYIPVYCPLCNTLMHGTLDQVGHHLLCPDCYTPVIVPPPAKPPPKPAHAVDDEYQVREEPVRPTRAAGPTPASAPTPAEAEETLIPVVCYLCQTRMYATADQVGREVRCPDCGVSTVVPTLDEARPKLGPTERPMGDYGVGKPAERPAQEAPVDMRLVRLEPGEKVDPSRTVGIVRVRPAPPKWPMFSGVLDFPLYSGTWPRLVGLTLGLLVVAPLLTFAIALAMAPPGTVLSAIPWTAAMIFFAAGMLAFLIWAVVASAFLLAVVRETAEGADEIEEWPETVFLDWILDFFFILNSLVVSLLPGVALAQVLAAAGLPYWFAVPGGVFFAFPLALMSMLEGDSPFKPLSWMVLESMFTVTWAWGLFYFEAGVLLAAFFFVSQLALYVVGIWGLIPVAGVWVVALALYFRLLGRLAWCCMQASVDEDEEPSEEQEKPASRRPSTVQPDALGPASPSRAQGPRDHEQGAAEHTRPRARPAPESPGADRDAPKRPGERGRSILDDDWEL